MDLAEGFEYDFAYKLPVSGDREKQEMQVPVLVENFIGDPLVPVWGRRSSAAVRTGRRAECLGKCLAKTYDITQK